MGRESDANPRQSERRLLIAFGAILILILAVFVYPVHWFSRSVSTDEAVLKQDLRTMREAIDQYTQDKMKAPQGLDDLVSAGYLHAIPKDPFTHTTDTWKITREEVRVSLDQAQTGMTDVHSGSNLTSSEGTAFSTW